jgi:nucleotide-binding universal stress UspA family protein
MGSIICGVDGTKSAARAVNVARALGAQLGLRLVFVRVVALGTAEEETAAIAEQLEELSASDDWLIEVGHPVDRLVAAAADDQVRLLVVGSHGPRSSLLGSVSAELSRRASCPVVVVPPGAQVRGDAVRPRHGLRRRHRAPGARRERRRRLRRRHSAL